MKNMFKKYSIFNHDLFINYKWVSFKCPSINTLILKIINLHQIKNNHRICLRNHHDCWKNKNSSSSSSSISISRQSFKIARSNDENYNPIGIFSNSHWNGSFKVKTFIVNGQLCRSTIRFGRNGRWDSSI